MKKILLSLVALAATSLTGFADTTLAEAYNSLANLSGMTEKTVSSMQVSPSATIKNLKTSEVNTSNVEEYRDKFIFMLENLPVRNMVLGANNMREIAAIYSSPAGAGNYNVLIVTGSTLNGNYSVSYGQTTKAGVDAIRNTQVNMDQNEIVLTPVPANGTGNYITSND